MKTESFVAGRLRRHSHGLRGTQFMVYENDVDEMKHGLW